MRGMLRRCRAKSPQLVLVMALASVAAGCSSTSRVATAQLFAGHNNAAPSGGVESRTLEPLGGNGLQNASAYASPGAAAGPLGRNAAALRARGWSLENAPIVEVTTADTAVTLSQGFGVPVPVILEANGLARPEDVRAGQRLVIPTYVRRDNPAPSIPAADATVAKAGPGAPPTTLNAQAGLSDGGAPSSSASVPADGHRVAAGETLWSISKRYGVSPGDVMTINNLPADGTVRLGEVLKLPGSATTQPRVETASLDPKAATGSSLAGTVAPALAKAPEPEPAAAPQKSAATAPASTSADVEDDGGTGFRWPVRGRLITGFGKQADGARNDGINLAVPAGTPVRAAEAGTVIYAGSELEGYGNLVLVQHSDDWVSAYAHNSDLKVNRGDTVKRGQAIAAAGATGSVDQPQVHFELRKRSKPVDPLPHLGGA